ncbi:MAG TPA: hypothetical protein VGV69_02625 [Solirubrobacterales bacterium]|nr:hypothetical protein [Solirubrobacterales bacterium]
MNPLAYSRRNLVAYVALFAALGTGTAFAAEKITGKDIALNAVRSKHLKNGQVRGADLAANAVTGDKVADGSLGGADVADNSLTGADVDESTLQLSAPPTPPAPDLSGYAEVVADGFIAGAGPLSTADRCNSVSTPAPGVQFNDQVVIAPTALYEDVVFTATVNADTVAYIACYTGPTGINLGGDVQFMVLRAQP